MKQTPDNAGLYIHVPFCRSKCPYCDFYSRPDLSLIPSWIKAVRKEISFYTGSFSTFDTIYFGGGNPGVLEPTDIDSLCRKIRENFKISSDAEFTVELNPEDATPEKLRAYRNAGANRISIGCQSFNDKELKFLGRRHNVLSVEKAICAARKEGFTSLNLDLMYGYQGQTPVSWEQTLEKAVSYGAEHISCYQMTFKEGTKFLEMKNTGLIKPVSTERERAFFLRTAEILQSAGYVHYEISNFAGSPEFFCRHNRNCWKRGRYLGLGPSAHSFDGGKRWWNEADIKNYCRKCFAGEKPVKQEETLNRQQEILEIMMLGFRTNFGVPLSILKPYDGSGRALADLEKQGLVSIKSGSAVPTRKGFLVADGLPLLFLHFS